jgi:hypothetical protein
MRHRESLVWSARNFLQFIDDPRDSAVSALGAVDRPGHRGAQAMRSIPGNLRDDRVSCPHDVLGEAYAQQQEGHQQEAGQKERHDQRRGRPVAPHERSTRT